MKVRAKFLVVDKTHTGDGADVCDIKLQAVIDGSEENKNFFKYTPSGQITFGVLNSHAADQFVVGRELYVDFVDATGRVRSSEDTPKTGSLEAAKGRLVKAFVDGKDAPVAIRQESDMDSGEMSFGEKAVGLTFNPGWSEQVTSIKRKFADVIDDLNAARSFSDCGEAKRLASEAITQAETAHMWAVRAIIGR